MALRKKDGAVLRTVKPAVALAAAGLSGKAEELMKDVAFAQARALRLRGLSLYSPSGRILRIQCMRVGERG